MSTTTPALTTASRPSDGGTPARRAVVRWAWRLFRREWRQQLLILALIVVAVAATIVGSAVATDSRPAANFGFGSAGDQVIYQSANARVAGDIATIQRRFGRTEVIENQTLTIPGTINTYQLRAESTNGAFSQPMLSLVSGHYPTTTDEVAVTTGVASAFHLRIGDLWHQDGTARRVVGVVENPQSLLDEFALVLPGQVKEPTQVIVLFNAPGAVPSVPGGQVSTPATAAATNVINPETISLTALILGMLLIALVSIGGFTVLAQRRLRSIGMLESLGATDKHVRLVVRANGAVVGIVGAVLGFLLGFVAWLAYRPKLEQSAHHRIGVFGLPWLVVVLAMVLAVVATYFAASRPAKAITRVPIVAALSGRPAPPRQIRRSAVPGIVLIVIAFVLLGLSGATNGNGPGMGELLLGLVVLVPGIILLAPFCLSLVALLARRVPISPRLALRDLARYRARSGSALAAISLGVLVAVIVCLAAAARYGNVLDYAGPNVAANELALHYFAPPPPGSIQVNPNGKTQVVKSSPPAVNPTQLTKSAQRIATALGAQLIPLESPDANINALNTGNGQGRTWNGAIYVATPKLLRAFGITSSEINPDTDILTARPGLSGVSGLFLTYGGSGNAKGNANGGGDGPGGLQGCTASHGCLAHPVIQELGALPAGTSAPNTVITEHAVRQFHLQTSTNDWLVLGTQPFTAAQITNAQATAATSQLSVESKNDQPSSWEVINWATAFGIILALGIVAMSVGLVRSEAASDLRTLTATGASSFTRRHLTAVTAGALGFLGALLGVVGGYIALIGWLRSNSLNGGVSALGNVPIKNLLVILVGMPLVAAVVSWLFAGREPAFVGRRPME
jgi:putative ABC transport system permease protein